MANTENEKLNTNNHLEYINLGDTVTTVIEKANKAILRADDNYDEISDLKEAVIAAGQVDSIVLDSGASESPNGEYSSDSSKAITLPVYTAKEVDEKVAAAGQVYKIALQAKKDSQKIEYSPTDKVVTLPVYTSSEVDTLIGNLAGGMKFSGVLYGSVDENSPTELPQPTANGNNNPEKGNTYKVARAGWFKYTHRKNEADLTGATTEKIYADDGDLIIYNGDSTTYWNPSWVLVPSGDDGDVYAKDNFGVDGEYIIVSANEGTDGKQVKSSGRKVIESYYNADGSLASYNTGDIPSMYTLVEANEKDIYSSSSFSKDGALVIVDGANGRKVKSSGSKITSEITTTTYGGDIPNVSAIKEIDKTNVKHVYVNGEDVVSTDDQTAYINFTDLNSSYLEISSTSTYWGTKTIDGITYNALGVNETDVSFEVYIDNKLVITQNLHEDGKMYILINKESEGKPTCTLRKITGGKVNITQINGGGGGTVADTTLYCHTLHIHGSVEPDRLDEGIISIEYNGYATFISKRADIFYENTLVDHLSMMDATTPPIGDGFNVKLYPANGFALVTAYIKDAETGVFTQETEQYQEAVPCGIYTGRNVAICWFGGDNEIEITDDMDTVVQIS